MKTYPILFLIGAALIFWPVILGLLFIGWCGYKTNNMGRVKGKL